MMRDQYRTELTRYVGKINGANETVEQYVIEIDKLNSVVNSIEKNIVSLKLQYETAVAQRNQAGIQLIDRNDELCILWEKHNVQELLLKKGELSIQEKVEHLRGAKIDLASLNRQLVLHRLICAKWQRVLSVQD